VLVPVTALASQLVREQLPQGALVPRLAPGPKVETGLRLAQAPKVEVRMKGLAHAPEVETRVKGMAGLSHNRI
jgi:hypothetical protein